MFVQELILIDLPAVHIQYSISITAWFFHPLSLSYPPNTHTHTPTHPHTPPPHNTPSVSISDHTPACLSHTTHTHLHPHTQPLCALSSHTHTHTQKGVIKQLRLLSGQPVNGPVCVTPGAAARASRDRARKHTHTQTHTHTHTHTR